MRRRTGRIDLRQDVRAAALTGGKPRHRSNDDHAADGNPGGLTATDPVYGMTIGPQNSTNRFGLESRVFPSRSPAE
jgi:hypothetical protein